MSLTISPIAYIRTPYREKFAIPRQPGLVPAATGRIEFVQGYCDPDYIRGIEEFSHLWLIFSFHANKPSNPTALVRPPRLGGNNKLGVFATRSTYRPNNLGLSVVKLDSVEITASPLTLLVSGMDLLDNTPIYDIKPYLPYADSLSQAQGGFAHHKPENTMKVEFLQTASHCLSQHRLHYPALEQLIRQILQQDPRPAYHRGKKSDREYGVVLYEFNVVWRVLDDDTNQVVRIEPVQS